ncbi:hypothetical protein FGG08_002743 [Glutinoglossum americanum]|uniref:Nephrocystin 3-like N-terminal domain-containing protein n=1 Tax=Glutinoglossum americanum TaxID=1670608 RepID=A0A9P8IB14_9PEZI|nr:hypothetical protein FGG08_002743 [Glutinoglossum americanum]
MAASLDSLLRLTSDILKCLSAIRNADKERGDLLREVGNLESILKSLQTSHPGHRYASMLNGPSEKDHPLEKLTSLLVGLRKRLRKAQGFKGALNTLAWPFKVDEINHTLSEIERQKSSLNMILQGQHLAISSELKEGLTSIGNTLGKMPLDVAKVVTKTIVKTMHAREQDSEREEKIKWIDPKSIDSKHDTNIKHIDAYRSRTERTGVWLTEDSEGFRNWMVREAGTFLWLHGIVLQLSKNSTPLDILCSIIAQLCHQTSILPDAVWSLETKDDIDRLVLVLRSLIQQFKYTYIIIDALDEYPDRRNILGLVKDICRLGETEKVHILITSRREQDIDRVLTPISAKFGNDRAVILGLDPDFVNEDINLHIKAVLKEDEELSCLSEDLKDRIYKSLIEGAEGMFRLVSCMLIFIRDCPTEFEIEKALETLPKDLNEVYDRIIAKIPNNLRNQANAALRWILCAGPLSLDLLAEAAILEPDEEPILNVKKRLKNAELIWKACSSLVKISEIKEIDEESILFGLYNNTVRRELSFAHYTVKTYLLSHRIREGQAFDFYISEGEAHAVVARSCLSYLLLFKQPESLDMRNGRHVFASYAAENWLMHVREAERWETVSETQVHPLVLLIQVRFWGLILLLTALLGHLSQWLGTAKVREEKNLNRAKTITDLIIELFDTSQHSCYINWLHHSNPDYLNLSAGGLTLEEAPSPLYMALLVELPKVFKLLLEGAAINHQGGKYHTAIQLAAYQGNEEALELLLERGANIHAWGGPYGTALGAAAAQGHETAFRILFENGAEYNAPEYINTSRMSPLMLAAGGGYESIVLLLLSKEADANDPRGKYAGALWRASKHGHEGIVKELLERGAQPDKTPALHDAVLFGSYSIAKLLVDNGADVNAPGNNGETPLFPAASNGDQCVRLLLESGADPNLLATGLHRCALHCAIKSPVEIAKLLLEAGANIDTPGENGTALQIAAAEQQEMLVKVLLQEGADVNAQGGKYGTALQAAAEKRNGVITEMLLEAGADANILGGKYGSALRAAQEEQLWYARGSWSMGEMVALLKGHGAVDLKAQTRRQRKHDRQVGSINPVEQWVPR